MKKAHITKQYYIKNKENTYLVKEKIKQEIAAKVCLIERYEKRVRFFRQNKEFEINTKNFYRKRNRNTVLIDAMETTGVTEAYWKAIWSNSRQCNKNSQWFSWEKVRKKEIEQQIWSAIASQGITDRLKGTSNWKTSEIFEVPNFWTEAHNTQYKYKIQHTMKDCTTTKIKHPATRKKNTLNTAYTPVNQRWNRQRSRNGVNLPNDDNDSNNFVTYCPGKNRI